MPRTDKSDTDLERTDSLQSVSICVQIALASPSARVEESVTSVHCDLSLSGPTVADQAQQYAFLNEGGKIGRRIRQLDWSRHPLGAIDTWDAALRTSLGIVLASPLPTFLVWGPDLTLFFNDAYEPMLGKKAHSIGSPYPAVWYEVWDSLEPYIRRVLAGESFFFENYATTLERRGYAERAWFTFSYGPVRDESGAVRGLLCTCAEVTDRMQACEPDPHADEGQARPPAMAGANEQRIRQSSEAIIRQTRQTTALVDELLAAAPCAGFGQPAGQPVDASAPSANLDDNIAVGAAAAAPFSSSATAPDGGQRLAPNDP